MAKNLETEIAEPEEMKEARIKIAKLISAEIDEIDKRRVQNPEQRLNAIANLYTAIK